MSDLLRNHIVGFLMTRFIYSIFSQRRESHVSHNSCLVYRRPASAQLVHIVIRILTRVPGKQVISIAVAWWMGKRVIQ